MKPTIRRWLALAIAFLGLYLALPDCGLAQDNQGDEGRGFRPGIPNGTYAFQSSGYVSGILVHSAAQLTFFANGTITGLRSSSFGGAISKVPVTGSFTVNGDGSVSLSVTASNETVKFDAYFTPDGNTFTFVDTAPGSNVNGFATRGR